MVKQRAIKLNLNNTFDENSYEVKGNQLTEGKNTVNFEPICVFTENKPRRAFFRSPRKLLIFVDGCLNAVKWAASTEQLQIAWSQQEAKGFVYKQITKAMEKFRPMKWSQFIILLAVNIISLLVLVKIAMTFGAL